MHTSKLTLATAMLFSTAAFAQFSTPTRDVENIARYSVSGSCSVNLNVGVTDAQSCELFFQTAPAGKAVVVKQITGRCVALDRTSTFVPGSVVFGRYLPPDTLQSMLGIQFVFGEPQVVVGDITYKEIRLLGLHAIYGVPPAGQVIGLRYSVARLNGTGQGTCGITATGYYVP